MLRDARSIPRVASLEADVCIVGAGPAGLALALELARAGRAALLLEGGGRTGGRSAQELYRGETSSLPALDLAADRFRGLGGTTSRWTGRCLPLTPLDFEPRLEIPHSGWPFGATELSGAIARAADLLGVAPPEPAEAAWRREHGTGPFDSRRLALHRAEESPGNFASRHGATLRGAAAIDVWLRAHAVEIELAPGGAAVAAIRAATLDGGAFRVRARDFVLAAGGIENPRLLLTSGRAVGNGVGNGHDVVGRYFMEHPYVDSALLTPAASVLATLLSAPSGVHGLWALAPQLARAEGLVQAAFYLRPCYEYQLGPAYHSESVAALRDLWHTWCQRQRPDSPWRALGAILAHPASALRVAAKRLGRLRREPPWLMLRTVVESAPSPDNRVTLAATTDRLGVPRPRVEWRPGAPEERAYERLHQVVEQEAGTLGLRFERLRQDPDWRRTAEVGRHHMGTTRMHDDPRRGVTDRESRVHGIDNLWIAGSSLFPTSGIANPTLTLVALAVRLAARLSQAASPVGTISRRPTEQRTRNVEP